MNFAWLRYASAPCAAAFFALAGCSAAASPQPDAAAPVEAGPSLPAEAGPPPVGDASSQPPQPDAGRLVDAAAGADAAAADAGSNAGTPSDAGTASDAGTPSDAGEPGPGFDANVPVVGATALDPGPTYLGTSGSDSTCSKSFRTVGFAPADAAAKHPLFLYFVGTQGLGADQSSRFDAEAPRLVTLAMAQRGFVALAVEYDNALGSFFTDKQPCLFGSGNPSSVIAKACALEAVDCSLGIATWGHSQGGLLAHAAANYDLRVKAVWTTGYSGLTGAKLPPSRFRAVNGENDGFNASVATSNATAGFTAADQCPDDGRDRCLRADGSGWVIVRKSACSVSAADHCWFNKRSCSDSAETLEPRWADPASDTPFALGENADWVASTVRRAGP
jgi:hypothetical protein